MLDLTKSDDELLTEMRRQTRYEVRRSAKLGIKVSYETSEKAFNDFYDLQNETAERQGFIQSPRKIALAQHEVYGDKARIYTAELDGKELAKGLILLLRRQRRFIMKRPQLWMAANSRAPMLCSGRLFRTQKAGHQAL